MLFLIYPSLITISFGLFNCYELNPGEKWLLKDLQIRCWAADHTFWSFLIGIPMILLWVIGIPIVGFRILYKRRETLFESETLARYKMMYQGLKRRFFYWEFVNLSRKLCIISINVFLSTFDSNYKVSKLNSQVHLQALCGVFVLVIYRRICENLQPYRRNIFNVIEAREMTASVKNL